MEKSIHSYEYRVLREWLITKRKDRGFSQRDVGKMLGEPHTVVGKIELGERRVDLVEYVRLCDVLKVDPVEGMRLVIEAIRKKS